MPLAPPARPPIRLDEIPHRMRQALEGQKVTSCPYRGIVNSVETSITDYGVAFVNASRRAPRSRSAGARSNNAGVGS